MKTNSCSIHVEKRKEITTNLGLHIDRNEVEKYNELLKMYNNQTQNKQHFKKPFLRFDRHNVDLKRTHLNKELCKTTPNLQKEIEMKIKEGYLGKKALRKDAVKCLEYVLGGSHDAMTRIYKEGKIDEFQKDCYNFIKEMHGENNILRCSLHLDETTPHIHMVVVPLTQDGRLSANEYIGNGEKLSDLQENYYQTVGKKYNLDRGEKVTEEEIKEGKKKPQHQTVVELRKSHIKELQTQEDELVIRISNATNEGLSLEEYINNCNLLISKLEERKLELIEKNKSMIEVFDDYIETFSEKIIESLKKNQPKEEFLKNVSNDLNQKIEKLYPKSSQNVKDILKLDLMKKAPVIYDKVKSGYKIKM